MTGSGPPMPELYEAVLAGPELEALVDDLSACGQVHRVRIKGGAQTRSRGESQELREAVALLVAGRIRGVQVEYSHAGQTWCDTLVAQGGGAEHGAPVELAATSAPMAATVRLVRMRVPVYTP